MGKTLAHVHHLGRRINETPNVNGVTDKKATEKGEKVGT
jgi:hypothetical protein